jgi:hypothetical protein
MNAPTTTAAHAEQRGGLAATLAVELLRYNKVGTSSPIDNFFLASFWLFSVLGSDGSGPHGNVHRKHF